MRPEIDMWIAELSVNINDRIQHVIEALKHLPRPAILYVTTKTDAEFWLNKIKLEGFTCLEMMHGGTSNQDRERIVKNWKLGKLDLVIGTSAFGLGINYLQARSIIHACVPEGLNRFYQEIGKAGRDNRSCLSLIIPFIDDYKIAKNISNKKIISDELGFSRWYAMFQNKINIDLKNILVLMLIHHLFIHHS